MYFTNSINSIKLLLISIILISFFLINCKTKKTVIVKPNWVTNRPNDGNYYIGIGVTSKTGLINQYQQTAKNNALKDLVSEISVNVSNSSFLHKLSVNDALKETYDSRTLVTANEFVEGYELISSFEDENNYWIYYQLSKQKYQELKDQRIKKALDNALVKYDNALNAKAKFQFSNTLILLIKAVEDVKPYLSETLITSYKNKEIYFGNALFSEILYCINELKITSSTKDITVKKGQSLNNNLLTFLITDSKGNKIENIPVIAEFSSGFMVNEKARSLTNGEVQFVVPKIKTRKNIDYFIAKINFNEIIQEATNDFWVKKLLKNINSNSFIKQVTIENPIFFIISNEKKFDLVTTSSLLKEATIITLLGNGIECVNSNKKADFTLEINSNSQQMGLVNNANKVTFTTSIIVKNTLQKIVYQRNINNLISLEPNPEAANSEVYNLGIDFLKKRIIPDILEQLL
jgi:hypothetical protein